MKKPSLAHIEAASRLLAHEGESAQDAAEAAGRVFEKVHLVLDPILGSPGVHSLLARSAKMAQSEFARLGGGDVVESASRLREGLRAHGPSDADAAAAALFGGFLGLLTSLVGTKVTTEVLRRSWPAITISVENAPEENSQ